MTQRIRDLLSTSGEAPDSHNVALRQLSRCLQADGPLVTWLHGSTGSGRTGLLESFAQAADQRDTAVVTVDCRTLEPTIAGLLGTLGSLRGAAFATLEEAAAGLCAAADRLVIAFDNYEVFRLADAWLRREFIPALADTARVVLASREPPTVGWISATEWREHFQVVSLTTRDGQSPEALTRNFMASVAHADLRQALEATSIVRRVTRPMLAALCTDSSPEQLFEDLAGLDCVERRSDGLALQEPVRQVLSQRLRAADIRRYRSLQQRAWRLLRQQLRDSARADLWRCTADVIYLIENPVIREAFFPSASAPYSVEPASPQHRDDILAIAARHEPDPAVRAMELWWTHLPSAFHVVGDSAGAIAGFYCMARPDELDSDWMQRDPVTRNWLRHLNAKGRAARAPSILLRRWLSREDGEAPSAVQAAAWVDIKRSYLELRPSLRRVYLTLRDIGPYGQVATRLGFQVLDELAVSSEGVSYHSAMLDFGPGSVDGWICGLLAAELGITDGQLLDTASHEMLLDGQRIALTPLEFKLVAMLESHAGAAVPREDILRQVWGHGHQGGSNVVDAVVRGLRRKLSGQPAVIETVRGVGYRLAGQFSSNSHE